MGMGFRGISVFTVLVLAPVISWADKCANMVAALEMIQKAAEPGRVLPAARAVLDDYSRETPARDLWFLGATKVDEERNSKEFNNFSENWIERHSASGAFVPVAIEGEPILRGGDKGGPLSVQEVVIQGVRKIFRPILTFEQTYLAGMSPEKVRRTYLASLLHDLMGFDFVPKSQLASITLKDGTTMIGVLSDFARGDHLSDANPLHPEFLDADSLGDILAFEFLVGNHDSRLINFFRHARFLDSVDHDLAFTKRVPTFLKDDSTNHFIGSVLPENYSNRMVAALMALTPHRLRGLFDGHLTTFEIENLIFRRDLILKDIHLRGSN